MHDLGVQVLARRGAGREDRGAPAGERRRRAQPELEREDGHRQRADARRHRPRRSSARDRRRAPGTGSGTRGSCHVVPATSMRASTSIGGIAAPLPSKTTTSGSRSAASAAPARTFESRPPRPARRPHAGSRSSAPRPARRSRGSPMRRARPPATASAGSSTVGGDSITCGSAGPPRPIATTTTSRSRASSARDVPGDRGLPDALARSDHRERRQRERLEARRIETEVGALVATARRRARGSRAASARAVRAPARPTGRRRPRRPRTRRRATRASGTP